MHEAHAKPSLTKRAGALAVLVLATFILMKIVVGFLVAIGTALAVIATIVAIVWAVRTL